MRRLSLSALFVSTVVSGFVACGGKVAFDGQPGQSTSSSGGHGGTTVSSTASVFDGPGPITSTGTVMTGPTSSVVVGVTSTGTSMSCDCTSVCTKLAGCGIPQQQCLNFCPQAGQATLDCLCNLPPNCQGFQQCLGMGPGTGAGGGMQGMKLPKICRDCVNQSAQGACQNEAGACFQNQECQAILDCHKQCGWGGPCVDQCDNQHPMGLADFQAFINCGACQQCPMQCGNSALNDYCPKPP